MERDDYTRANRESWERTEPLHRKQTFEKLLAGFRSPGFIALSDFSQALLAGVGVQGKAVAQLCCNNGRELLSIKNMGAGRCLGVDISDSFIHQARQFAQAGGLDVDFLASDVYTLPEQYNGQFDLVFISIGALGWMPDLAQFFRIVARLLKPGGQVLIYEMHPMLDMFEGYDHEDPPPMHHSYFRTEPYADNDGLDYLGGTAYEAPTSYWFHHKVSDIIMCCLHAGMTLESFEEYDHDISNVFEHFNDLKVKPALSYSLLARKS